MAIEIPTKQNSEEPEFLRDSIDSPSPIGSSTDEVNTEENAAITSIKISMKKQSLLCTILERARKYLTPCGSKWR